MSPQFFQKQTEPTPRREIIPPKEFEPESKEKLVKPESEPVEEGVAEVAQEKEAGFKPTPIPPPAMAAKIVPLDKSEALIKIEGILEEELEDAYFKMDPALRQQFKAKGEDTAKQIEKILAKTKVKTKKIFKLILAWLKIIPGVSKFFIRQEAKIKTDKIIHLK
ncbi:MAG: hypothetical protein WC675_01465 [Patescibacteria group bacterium]|jgi:hypothetical protein